MKRLTFTAFACALALMLAACSNSSSPKGTVEEYAKAVIKGDYRAALDYVAFKGTPEEVARTRDQYASLCEEKTKDGLKDSEKLTDVAIDNEEIDTENGTATVTATMTYQDGHSKTDQLHLVKDEDGKWLIDNGK